MDKYEMLKAFIASLEGDLTKFYQKDNKAAGTRVRGKMMELKKIAQEIRMEVSEKKKEK